MSLSRFSMLAVDLRRTWRCSLCLEATAPLRTAELSIALSLIVHAALVEAGTNDCIQRGRSAGS